MRKCKKCNHFQDASNFCKGKLKKDGTYSLHSWCKKCVSSARMDKYYQNPKAHRAYDDARQQKITDQYKEYLENHPCIDCGNNDIRVLEFDHINADNKEYNISTLVRKGCTWDKVLKEIEKCEVVCANCHRIRTYSRDINCWRNITQQNIINRGVV